MCTVQACATLGSYLATALDQEFGVPELKNSPPYGIAQTDRWFRELGELIGKEKEVEDFLKEDAGYVVGLSRFLLHETGIVPKEQFIVDNTPQKYIEQITSDLKAASDKRDIPVYFNPDAGAAQNIIREVTHSGRGLIMGSGWDKELAKEKNYDFLSISLPTPYRLVLTTNYIGYTGGLRVIEDIYDTVLYTYK